MMRQLRNGVLTFGIGNTKTRIEMLMKTAKQSAKMRHRVFPVFPLV
jgi:hypothetical protein